MTVECPRNVRLWSLALLLSASAVSACHTKEPLSPSVGLTLPVDPPDAPDLGRGAPRMDAQYRYHIWLDDSVRDICKGPSPFFEFDSAQANGVDQPTMKTLAACMADGPLKGRTIRLIGRTDPRGAATYNEKLGLERAQKVKTYLVNHGIDTGRVLVESGGEEEASAAHADWPRDRRVEIQVAK